MTPETKARFLSHDLHTHFHRLDHPPADELHVPVDLIREDAKEKDTYVATLRYIVNYGGRKVHSVRIKFNTDAKGKFIPSSWHYV